MQVNIDIFDNKALVRSLNFGPGDYSIGRGPDNDVVLDHKSISKRHAVFRITEDAVAVEDKGSVNGVRCKGHNISNESFTGPFRIDIGPYHLDFKFGDRQSFPETDSGDGLRATDQAANYFNWIFYAALVLLLVLTAACVYYPLRQYLADYHRQTHLKRGILLARYLSEINSYFLEIDRLDLANVGPVIREENVNYALVTDNQGMIIAPADKRGQFLNWAMLPKALNDKTLTVDQRRSGETIIYYPVKIGDRLFGGAILGLKNSPLPMGEVKTTFYIILFIWVLVAMGVGYLLLKLFSQPLRRLDEELNVAIKEQRSSVNAESFPGDIRALAQSVNRMLKKAGPETVSVPERFQDRKPLKPAGEAPKSKKTPPTASLDDTKAAWCVIDLDQHAVVDGNAAFYGMFEISEAKKNAHILEVFTDPVILQAITELLEEDGETEKQLKDAQKVRSVRKMSLEGGSVAFVFKEEENHVQK